MAESTGAPTGTRRGRGGLGKYLRAKGRRGTGRPAQFSERLLLEGEGPVDEDDEEEAERMQKFSRRQLGTNAERYVEPAPELDSDGEPIVEPEVDLSSFLERQRLSEAGPSTIQPEAIDEDDIDHSLAHLTAGVVQPPRKGKVEIIEWTEELDDMTREKASAEANWELKSRFRAKSDKLRSQPVSASSRKQLPHLEEAPPLPDTPVKTEKDQMEDFLDDLLG